MEKKKKEIPQYELPIIETHCHLDYLKELPLDSILEKCKQNKIETILTISVSPSNLAEVRRLSQKYPFIFGTQGIHPHEAKLYNECVEEEIKKCATHDKIVAIGEIGLDFHYNNSPREDQLSAFRAQLNLAIDLELPVVIHSRDADKETIDILNEYAPKLKRKGVIHSFTSGIDLAKRALDLGFYLGFNGIITFKNAQNVRDIVTLCPLDRVLIETDSPFLTPAPFRGKENAPYYLPLIIEKIAEIKKQKSKSILSTANENAKMLFRFSQ